MSFCKWLPQGVARTRNQRPRTPQESRTNTGKVFFSGPASRADPGQSEPVQAPRADPRSKRVDVEGYEVHLFSIDAEIRRRLRDRRTTVLAELKDEAQGLAWIRGKSQDPIELLRAGSRLRFVNAKIVDLTFDYEYGFYVLRTDSLFREYEQISKVVRPHSFMFTGGFDAQTRELMRRREEISFDFVRIVSEFVKTGHLEQRQRPAECGTCHSPDLAAGEEGLVCARCGTVKEDMDDAPSFSDTDRVNMATRYVYTCKGHFVDAMNAYEAIQNVSIPDAVKEALHEDMRHHGLGPATVTREHLYKFLTERGLNKQYANINLIHHMITGKEPPNISQYRPHLLELFDEFEEVYSEVKDPTRINALNVNFKLHNFLRVLGYPCKPEDFFYLRTSAKLREHQEKFNEVVAVLAERYPNSGWKPCLT